MDCLQATAHRHQQEEVHQQVLEVGMDQGVADIPPGLSGPAPASNIYDTYYVLPFGNLEDFGGLATLNDRQTKQYKSSLFLPS